MLPPIDQTTLERNQKFKVLYEDIVRNKLNADASTKDVKKQRVIDEARKELTTKRTEMAKTQILTTSLDTLSARAADLPDEVPTFPELKFRRSTPSLTNSQLHEVITIIAAQLNNRIPPSERDILQEDIQYFTDHIVPISRALSAHLKSTALQLCRIAEPETEPSPASSIPALPQTALDQQADLAAAAADLAARRTALADLTASVLGAQTQVLEVAIRVLEQTVHGSAARAVRARAEHLAAVAKGLELKLGILVAGEAGGELERAVERYAAWLGEERRELAHRREVAEERLRGFEGEGKVMREVARRYGEVEAEIERVREEVGRLEGR